LPSLALYFVSGLGFEQTKLAEKSLSIESDTNVKYMDGA
jgi:hypothetical protein